MSEGVIDVSGASAAPTDGVVDASSSASNEQVNQSQGESGQVSAESSQADVQAAADSSPEMAENIEQLKEDVQDAIKDGADEKEIKQLIKEFELKVNGRTVKAKIDLSDEEAVKRELQKSRAFDDLSQKHTKEIGEKDRIVKGLAARINEWKDNPEKMFEALELDPDQFATSYLERKIAEMNKSPEQKAQEEVMRRQAELEERVKAYEERERKVKELLEAKQREAEEQAHIEMLTQEIDSALSKSSVLSVEPEMRTRLADMMAAYSNKYPDKEITAEMVLPKLEAQVLKEQKLIASKLDPDRLEEIIGKEKAQALLNKYLKQSKEPKTEQQAKPTLPNQTIPANDAPKKEEVKPKFKSLAEAEAYYRNLR